MSMTGIKIVALLFFAAAHPPIRNLPEVVAGAVAARFSAIDVRDCFETDTQTHVQ